MQKTLARDADRTEIFKRIASLTPKSPRQWGQMTAGEMICHLYDAYLLGLRELTAEPVKLPIPAPVIKFISLRLPTPWPRNLSTTVELRQGGKGTTPGNFADDQTRLLKTLERFCADNDLAKVKHPFFGPMTEADWMRWAYLHADHHLRQFSA